MTGDTMKLLIATPLYPPYIGGPATYTKLLERELPSRGFSVHVVSFSGVRRLPKIIRHLVYLYRLLRAGRKADALYALDPVSVGLPTLITARILRKRFFLRVAGDYAWEQANERYGVMDTPDAFVLRDTNSFPFPITVLAHIERFVAQRAEKIIVPSRYLGGVIAHWGVDARKVHVVSNGIEKMKRESEKDSMRQLLNFRGKFIISSGRLIPLKGFDALVEVFPEIRKTFPDARLLIAGDGPERARLESLVVEKGIEDSVSISKPLPHDVLLRYVETADVLVANALHETFPHQVLEAMAVRTPVVATRVGGIPEIIEDGKDGILIPFGDRTALVKAILSVLGDEARSRSLVRGAEEKVSRFAPGPFIDTLAGLLGGAERK